MLAAAAGGRLALAADARRRAADAAPATASRRRSSSSCSSGSGATTVAARRPHAHARAARGARRRARGSSRTTCSTRSAGSRPPSRTSPPTASASSSRAAKTKIAHPAVRPRRLDAPARARGHGGARQALQRAESGRILRAVAPAADDGERRATSSSTTSSPSRSSPGAAPTSRSASAARVRRRFLRIGSDRCSRSSPSSPRSASGRSSSGTTRRSPREATKWLSVAVGARDLVDDRLPESLLLGLEANRHSEQRGGAQRDDPRAREGAAVGRERGARRPERRRERRCLQPGRAHACERRASDGAVRLWNVRTHRPRGRAHRSTEPSQSSVAFSPDGRTLAAGGSGGSIRLWDLRTRRPIGALEGHADDVTTVSVQPRRPAARERQLRRNRAAVERPVTTGRWAGRWSVASPRPTGSRSAPTGGSSRSPAPPARAAPYVCGTRGPAAVRAALGGGNAANGVAFSPDGRWLVAAGTDGAVGSGTCDGVVLSAGRCGGPGARSSRASRSVARASSPASTGDGEAWLWRLPAARRSARRFRRTRAPSGRSLQSRRGHARDRRFGRAPVGGRDSPRARSTAHRAPGDELPRRAVSPTGTLAALDQDGSVRLWSLAGNSPVRQTVKVDPSTSAIAFTAGRAVSRRRDERDRGRLGRRHGASRSASSGSARARSASPSATTGDAGRRRPLGRRLAVGSRHAAEARAARGRRGGARERRVLSRRPHARSRSRGRNRAVVGSPRPGSNAVVPEPARGTSTRSPSARTACSSRRAAGTGPCGCGTSRP